MNTRKKDPIISRRIVWKISSLLIANSISIFEPEKILAKVHPKRAPANYAAMYKKPRTLSNLPYLTFPIIYPSVMHGLKWEPLILAENMIVTNMPRRRPTLSVWIVRLSFLSCFKVLMA